VAVRSDFDHVEAVAELGRAVTPDPSVCDAFDFPSLLPRDRFGRSAVRLPSPPMCLKKAGGHVFEVVAKAVRVHGLE
jgi:hypothetical protein